jgi:hypothetical protein
MKGSEIMEFIIALFAAVILVTIVGTIGCGLLIRKKRITRRDRIDRIDRIHSEYDIPIVNDNEEL